MQLDTIEASVDADVARERVKHVCKTCGTEEFMAGMRGGCNVCRRASETTRRTEVIEKANQAKRFVCDICGGTYANAQGLATHKTRKHTKADYAPQAPIEPPTHCGHVEECNLDPRFTACGADPCELVTVRTTVDVQSAVATTGLDMTADAKALRLELIDVYLSKLVMAQRSEDPADLLFQLAPTCDRIRRIAEELAR